MNPFKHNKKKYWKKLESVLFSLHFYFFSPKRLGERGWVAHVLHMRFQKRTDLVVEERPAPRFCLHRNPLWDSGRARVSGSAVWGTGSWLRGRQCASFSLDQSLPFRWPSFLVLRNGTPVTDIPKLGKGNDARP